MWDFIIEQKDLATIYYLTISFLQKHKEAMLQLESAFLVDYLSKMKINTIDELNEIKEMSMKIKQKTPYSLNILIKSLEIFVPRTDNLKTKFEMIRPQNFPAFPIFPSEMLFITFPSVLTCPEISCENFKNNYEGINWAKKGKCAKCLDNGMIRDINFCLFDLRICKSKDKKFANQGLLPSMQFFDQKKLIEKGIEEEVVKITDQLKDEYHLVMVTNLTENYENIENKIYKEKVTEEELLLRKVGLSWNDSEKEMEKSELKKYLKDNKKNKNAYLEVKEYDNLKEIIKHLIKTKHKYISFAYGGYKDIHSLVLLINIPLTSHLEAKCELCKKVKKAKPKTSHYISEEQYMSLSVTYKCKSFFCEINGKSASIIITKGTVFIFTSQIKGKNSRIEYEVKYRIRKINIIANEKKNGKLYLLYSHNFSQSNLENIILDLFSESEVDKLILEINK